MSTACGQSKKTCRLKLFLCVWPNFVSNKWGVVTASDKRNSPPCLKIKKGMKKKSLGELQFHHLGHLDYSDNMFHEEAFQRRGKKSLFSFFPLFINFPPLSSVSKIQLEEHTGGLESFTSAKSSKTLCVTMNLLKLPQNTSRCYLVQTINLFTCSPFAITNSHQSTHWFLPAFLGLHAKHISHLKKNTAQSCLLLKIVHTGWVLFFLFFFFNIFLKSQVCQK